MRSIFALAMLAVAGAASAVTFTSAAGPGTYIYTPPTADETYNNMWLLLDGGVPTTGTGGPVLSVPITVGPGATITSVSLTFNQLAHSWVGDILMTLTSPGGTTIEIMDHVGGATVTAFGSGNNLDPLGTYTFADGGTAFNSLAVTTPRAGATGTIPSGTYATSTNGTAGERATFTGNFASFIGQNQAGVWTLTMQDFAAGDLGAFNTYSLNITSVPEPGTMIAIGAGLAAMVARRRRK